MSESKREPAVTVRIRERDLPHEYVPPRESVARFAWRLEGIERDKSIDQSLLPVSIWTVTGIMAAFWITKLKLPYECTLEQFIAIATAEERKIAKKERESYWHTSRAMFPS